MTTLKYNLSDYRASLKFSHHKHILVEGKDDKRVFLLFLDELLERTSSPIVDNVQVDSAQSLIEFENAGNREKVEIVCENIVGKSYSEKIIGFVDREFREFNCNPQLSDNLEEHRVIDRLVWSRGHSIENYCFDFDTLRVPLRDFSLTDKFCDALNLFESVFEETIGLACAASLAGDEVGMLSLVKSSADQHTFDIDFDGEPRLKMKTDCWERNLVGRCRTTPEIAEQLIDRFQYWSERVNETEFSVVRWMCHGHIGLSFIWAVYSHCVIKTCQKNGYEERKARAEARRVLKAEESVRFNACAARWVERSLGNQCIYPIQVFDLINLSINN
jgi:hypothetical protein